MNDLDKAAQISELENTVEAMEAMIDGLAGAVSDLESDLDRSTAAIIEAIADLRNLRSLDKDHVIAIAERVANDLEEVIA
ncbi:MAG UNVERIFIED_CONTAM: hypothetical protein LOD86_02455 [Thermobifida fusca]